ncbi:ABC transporter permease [Herbiconiux ginsengi]|uniref:Monosaccharide ABC transporter membrane protein, CUT2 family n=1 Tax=Herbiconiux ginsengi TaxID=381665 RepID=A0A1H3TVH6_9MICO|nr:ABC transporter permease [Herbiconiux ginsengi]SDZ54058.1 monosaccharide ABC transporter membrane protein, CUT2 family [Herbiconiux ginsengi]
MTGFRAALVRRPYLIAVVLAAILLAVNVVAMPSAAASYWPGLIANLAPLAFVAIASTPSVLGGGIDLSIGPQVVLSNIVIVMVLLPAGIDSPWAVIPIVLALGILIGTINGVLVALLRFPAMIATLCVMFVLIGIAQRLAPQPAGGSTPWIEFLTSRAGLFPIAALVIAVPFAVWLVLRRTSFVRNLLAAGGDPIAATSAGVPVSAVRLLSYTLGGLFASIGGLMLTSLLRSADASQASTLVLIGLAAVALGGTAFTGGRGGLLGSLAGALCIFLIQNLLTALSVPAVWINVIYGLLLVGSVVLSASLLSQKNVRQPV